ncbi:L,D-transpeptidase family protein [Actinoplanes italicus]|uniref:Putative peptidoglycan binding protein n=1 Tax=Actinoplanes italicus TaxID=113567 RepID=A0A2T0JQ57_9ACTN|nr:L,D-transpeptidase family protein [Actinoplanes italicus]PRX09755.1 putative peptidoglycan binding protein [Actinoplanes italicus]
MSGSPAAVYLLSAAAVLGLAVAAGPADVASMLESVVPPASATTAARPTPPAGKSFVTVIRHDARPASTGEQDGAAPANSDRLRTTAAAPCTSGRWQHAIEENLARLGTFGAVSVDGRQSPADCAAIRGFQQRFGIEPAAGQADATTADVARRITASSAPEKVRRCDAGPGVTACVDLTLQTAWVMRDGAVVAGPTVVRTGFAGHATPAGVFRINKRAEKEWSDSYEVWLPYWQRFVGGIGFHETTTYLHDAARGSHGCVNLLHRDAVTMWDQLQMGARVHAFGRRPGT